MRRIRLRRKKSRAWIFWVILIVVILGFFLFRGKDEPVLNQTVENMSTDQDELEPIVIEADDECIQKVVVETFEVPVQVEKEFEKEIIKNRTIIPEFDVLGDARKRGGYYITWEYEQFAEFIENIEFSGWSDTKEAQYTSELDGQNLARNNITIKNRYDDEAEFTIRRYFSLKQKEYYLDEQNSMTKTFEGKQEFIFNKGVLCYFIKDGTPDIKDFVDFLDEYSLNDEDAVVFGKNDRVWGCIRARYEITAEEIVEDYTTYKTYTKLVNSTVNKLFNRIITEC